MTQNRLDIFRSTWRPALGHSVAFLAIPLYTAAILGAENMPLIEYNALVSILWAVRAVENHAMERRNAPE